MIVSEKNQETIYQNMQSIIYQISGDLSSSSSKAHLAQLRQSIGRDIYTAAGVFPFIFSNISDRYLGEKGDLTDGERAIITTLQLYALHQQGNSVSVNISDNSEEGRKGCNLGAVLSTLRTDDNTKAIDRRFNAMITATSFNELTTHMRHLIKMLKSKNNVKINYPQLAEDLYWFQKNDLNSLRLKWSRSYYRKPIHKEGEKEND